MYSQQNEEHFILRAFEGREPRQALEIGSWDAKQFSNVRALYEIGWNLVCVEPSPKPMLNLLEEYGNDLRVKLIQAAVALTPGLLEIHVSDDAVSTSSEAEYQKWKYTAAFRGKLIVPAITLEDIGNRYAGFEMVSIDTEGTSVDLFHEMIRLNWRPRCVVCEHNDRLAELLTAASSENYSAVFTNSANVVLVR